MGYSRITSLKKKLFYHLNRSKKGWVDAHVFPKLCLIVLKFTVQSILPKKNQNLEYFPNRAYPIGPEAIKGYSRFRGYLALVASSLRKRNLLER